MELGAGFDLDQIRLDKWLVYARFCKTRSQALKLIEGGIRVNGRKIEKPDTKLHIGDVLTLALAASVLMIRVKQLAERRGSPKVAQELYEVVPETALNLE